MWDELCVQVQGQESPFWDAYLDTIRPIISANLNELDVEAQLAIWLQTDAGIDWAINEDQEDTPESDIPVHVDTGDIAEYILAGYVLSSAANWSNARIERYMWEQGELESRAVDKTEPLRNPLPMSPGSPRPLRPSQSLGMPDPVDPRLLLIAKPDGSLKPEFAEWEQELQLEASSLVPVWWPHEQDGQVLNPKEREETFASALDVQLKLKSASPSPSSSATSPISVSTSRTPQDSTAQAVLKSLLRLRSVVLQG